MSTREIKFRAWNKSTNKMVDLMAITCLAVDPEVYKNSGGIYLPFTDSFILEQYIGIKDVDGKEVYEGDRYFDLEYKVNYTVKYDTDTTQFTLISDDGRWCETSKVTEVGEFKYIGNIHEVKE